MFEVQKPCEGVLHLVFEHQKDLSFSMFRLEEFYEGPFEEVKGKYFDLATFMELYTDEYGSCDYFSGWDGFNVPRWAVDKFYQLFSPHGLSSREKAVIDAVLENNADYLIATTKDTVASTVLHEIAHAKWATDPEYKKNSIVALAGMPVAATEFFTKYLLEGGYPADPDIMLDEHHAYIKTSSNRYIREVFKPLGTLTIRAVLSVKQELLRVDSL